MPEDTIRDVINESDLMETLKEFQGCNVDNFQEKFKDSFLYKTLSLTTSEENNQPFIRPDELR